MTSMWRPYKVPLNQKNKQAKQSKVVWIHLENPRDDGLLRAVCSVSVTRFQLRAHACTGRCANKPMHIHACNKHKKPQGFWTKLGADVRCDCGRRSVCTTKRFGGIRRDRTWSPRKTESDTNPAATPRGKETQDTCIQKWARRLIDCDHYGDRERDLQNVQAVCLYHSITDVFIWWYPPTVKNNHTLRIVYKHTHPYTNALKTCGPNCTYGKKSDNTDCMNSYLWRTWRELRVDSVAFIRRVEVSRQNDFARYQDQILTWSGWLVWVQNSNVRRHNEP